MGTAGLIRIFILVDIIGLAILALVYLAQRRLRRLDRLFLSLIAICLPILGPFLVISLRPGEWNPEFSFSGAIQQIGAWFQRLLPVEPQTEGPALARSKSLRKPRKRALMNERK